MAVYFIQAGDGGPVKIGKADDALARMQDLQVAHWNELTLMRVIDGGHATERWLHRFYGSLHLRGEWFRYSDCMLTIEPPALIAQPSSALHRAVDVAGGQTELARKLGTSQARVWQWLRPGRRLPAEYVLQIERATGVPRHELRPDLYPQEAA